MIKNSLLRMACMAALAVLTAGSSVQAQNAFSPTVNALRSHYQQNRRAAADSTAAAGIIALWMEAANGTVELPQLPAGVYAVKIGNQGSTLIRL